MLYITSSWLTYFITEGLYLLIPFTNFTHLPQYQQGTTYLYLSLFSFCFYFLIFFDMDHFLKIFKLYLFFIQQVISYLFHKY